MCIQLFENKILNDKFQVSLTKDRDISDSLADELEHRFYDSLGRNVSYNASPVPLGLKQTWSLTNVFTVVYTLVDDFYKTLFGSPKYFRVSPNHEPIFSDAEVLTLALVKELKGSQSDHGWWNYVSKNYRDLFPKLCDRSRYVRRLELLKPALEQIRKHLLTLLNADLAQLRVVDSFPLSVCHLARVKNSRRPFEYFATFGYCATKKEHFYGFKVHLVTDPRGIIVGFMVTSGHVHDTKGLVYLLADNAQEEAVFRQLVEMFGDKGYVGEDYQRLLEEEFGVKMWAMRKNEKESGPSASNEIIGQGRKIIETTISVLTGVFHGSTTTARSVKGLMRNLLTKITSFNLGNYLNILMGEPVLQVSSIVN
jgi:Transposase DDE domain